MSTATLEQIDAKLDAVLRQLNAVQAEKKPNLNIAQFAKLAGVDRKTVYRHLIEGRIRKVNGRIPRDQLLKYTS